MKASGTSYRVNPDDFLRTCHPLPRKHRLRINRHILQTPTIHIQRLDIPRRHHDLIRAYRPFQPYPLLVVIHASRDFLRSFILPEPFKFPGLVGKGAFSGEVGFRAFY